MAARGLVIHTAILAVAAGLAFKTFTKEESTTPQHGETELWPGKPDQVQELRFEHKVGTLTLVPHQDSNGTYYVGTGKKNAPEKKPEAANQSADPNAPKPAPEEPKTGYFIATKDGDDLIGQLAPLKALRTLGKVSDADKSDFGFDQIDGKLYLKIGGTQRELLIGGTTPGGSDYYVKDGATGNAYVVAGSIVRDLMNADQRLVEHKMHAFEDSVPKRVKITAGGATREFVRSADKKDAWTKPGTPNDKDETATNWLSKVDRLRTTSYEGEKLSPPPAPADQILRIDYFDDRKPLGYLELVRRPPTGEGPEAKPEYVARTENTRWFATVIRSAAEQIEQDMKSVVQ